MKTKIIARRFIYFSVVIMTVVVVPALSFAHGIAGKRFFPTTFAVDDPFISDEFSILINHIKQPGDEPNKATELNIDLSKRIFPNFGLEFHEAYLHLGSDGDGSTNGWENLGVGAKWQFLTNDEHELIMSIGTDIDVGGTGAHQLSESYSHITPGLFFGKGLGDLPDSLNFFRPFAITGVIGTSFPTRRKNVILNDDGSTDTERNPTTFNWGFTVQYSLMYLQSFVKDIGLGSPFNRMILVTEFPMQTNLSGDGKGQTTGTVNPGIVWAGKFMELGIAAQIPINSRSGKNVGVLGLIHLFIDDLFPHSIGGADFPLKIMQTAKSQTTFALLLLSLLLVLPGVSQGHAFPDHSDPKVGSTVSGSPAIVRIWFDSDLEPAFSKIMVHSANNEMVDKRDSRVDPSDPKLLEVSVPRLPPGTYRVFWDVVARDGHRTSGDFTFTVK